MKSQKIEKRILLAKIIITFVVALLYSINVAKAHGKYIEQVSEVENSSVRFERLRYLKQHELDKGLGQRASMKLLEAKQRTSDSQSNESFDLQYAFPFTANPELSSKGEVETLTILLDFKDYQVDQQVFTKENIYENIYGEGTTVGKNFKPYESVHAYYLRASEGSFDLNGDVIDWYHFSQNADKYSITENEVNPFAHQQAIFNLVQEVLNENDQKYDYSKYDNDNDGDIDQITIIYNGPQGSWGSFWWAYQWKFDLIPDAFNTFFDGKRLNQFVFQPLEGRKNFQSDFDPTILIHETGHALGLPDYYDYDDAKSSKQLIENPAQGPSGGVGGLDIMDGNWGNHSAFSRWLLGWINPVIVGGGKPVPRELLASGSEQNDKTKAIAIFPGIRRGDAPDSELFLIENRHRLGNDGGTAFMPSDGILVWHVNARVENRDFLYNNTDTEYKLLRLINASNLDSDFDKDNKADAGVYFKTGGFASSVISSTNNSTPRDISNDIEVVIREVSKPAEIVIVSAGMSRKNGQETTSIGVSSEFRQENKQYKELIGLTEKLRDPKEIKKIWSQSSSGQESFGSAISSQELGQKIILTQWATKDGVPAVQALLATGNESFIKKTFPLVMEAWVNNNPETASKWYFSKAGDAYQKSLEIPSAVLKKMFVYMASKDKVLATKLLSKLYSDKEKYIALGGIYLFNKLTKNKYLINNNKDISADVLFLEEYRKSIENIDKIKETDKIKVSSGIISVLGFENNKNFSSLYISSLFKKRIKDFQKNKNLKDTGVVDENTFYKLLTEVNILYNIDGYRLEGGINNDFKDNLKNIDRQDFNPEDSLLFMMDNESEPSMVELDVEGVESSIQEYIAPPVPITVSANPELLTETEIEKLSNSGSIYSSYEVESGKRDNLGTFIPYSVIGEDTRTAVIDTLEFPSRAVVQIVFKSKTGENHLCSGSLISEDTVLTAGHCIHSGSNQGELYSDYVVYPGRNKIVKPFGSCGVVKAYTLQGWVAAEAVYDTRNYDIGALKLDCKVGRSTGWFGLRAFEGAETGLSTTVHGYAGDKLPPGVQWLSTDEVRAMHDLKGFYKNDTYGGTSGSPVYSGDEYIIFGVHTNGAHNGEPWASNNAFTKINKIRFETIMRWIND
jgi:M6 family metalloprotease-like protein